MTRAAADTLATARRLGVAVENRGGRLWAGPAERVTEALRDDLRRHKGELLSALASGAVAVPVAADFDRGDMQVRAETPSVPVFEGDKQVRLKGDGKARPGDRVGLPAGHNDADRLEGFAVEQVGNFFAVHTHSLADGWDGGQGAAAPDGWSRESWHRRLSYLATICEPYNTVRAAELRTWADALGVI